MILPSARRPAVQLEFEIRNSKFEKPSRIDFAEPNCGAQPPRGGWAEFSICDAGLPACTAPGPDRRDVQPRWPHHKSATLIRPLSRLDQIVVRASSLHSSRTRPSRCAAKMAAPQTRHADSPFVSAEPNCGAGFQPARLRPDRRDVQPRWPHHKPATLIRPLSRLDQIVVRASSLHSSRTRPSRCAAKMAAPQTRHADSPFVSAGPNCGAGFQPARLQDPTVRLGGRGL